MYILKVLDKPVDRWVLETLPSCPESRITILRDRKITVIAS